MILKKNSKKKHKFTYEACNAKEKQLWQTSIITCMLSYTTTSKVKRERDKQNTFHLLPLSKKFSISTENNNNRNKCSFFSSFKFPSSHHVYECDLHDLHDHHKRHHQSNISSSSMLRKTITSKEHKITVLPVTNWEKLFYGFPGKIRFYIKIINIASGNILVKLYFEIKSHVIEP